MLTKTDYIGTGRNTKILTGTEDGPRQLLELLKRQAPRGKEQAWNMILDGLLGLLGNGTL